MNNVACLLLGMTVEGLHLYLTVVLYERWCRSRMQEQVTRQNAPEQCTISGASTARPSESASDARIDRDAIAFEAIQRADIYRDYLQQFLTAQGLDFATVSKLVERLDGISDDNKMSIEP